MKASFPPLTPDDPRLTTYALGEIDDPAERTFIEGALDEKPELKQIVEETCLAEQTLTRALAQEALPKIEALPELDGKEAKPAIPFPSRPMLAAAASVALVLGLGLISAFVLKQPTETDTDLYSVIELSDSIPQKIHSPEIAQSFEFEAAPLPVTFGRSMQASRPRGSATSSAAFFTAAQEILVDFEPSSTESYDPIEDTGFQSVLEAPRSTFSVDVDTASYANVRRFIQTSQRPPADAVRVEELINRFDYAYPVPKADAEHPFSTTVQAASAPWAPEHALVRIGLQGHDIPWEARPASNLVFLMDVSGSMNQPNKLPLVKKTLDILVRRMSGQDRIAVVVYAGNSGIALPSTTADNHETIMHAIQQLQPGGSTNGNAGIELAYEIAQQHFIKGGNNRVILCTDGDFNVGISDRGSLKTVIEEKAQGGVFLSVLGFGMGNYKDDMLELLSNSGNGTYAYIDSEKEARRVFLQDLTGSLFTIAKDVKIQVEFNPTQVQAYRLIGYENRRLADEDFNNDKKDAGDIGAGNSVTALYEVVPHGVELTDRVKAAFDIDPLKYTVLTESQTDSLQEWLTVKLRYKQPDGDTSRLLSTALRPSGELASIAESDEDFRWATAVAMFGEKLRGNAASQQVAWADIESLAQSAQGRDPYGDRTEFLQLIRTVQQL
ncbi:MAG: VWA domain-containing protein [Opitutales bacterium]|nr:VWA domain-containing protein [Opitutales bacterium]